MLQGLAYIFATLLLAGCSQDGASTSERESRAYAQGAFCRPTPNGRRMTGCYLTVRTTAQNTLVSVSTPLATRVEIHESRVESGMMMMSELRDGLPLPAMEVVELKPGGNHIMLMGLTRPLVVGDTVPLTLKFDIGLPIEVVATVAQPPAS